MVLLVTVRDKCAQLASHPQSLVCGNAGHILHFSFDPEWDGLPLKTARIIWMQGENAASLDVPLVGNQCALPVIRGADQVLIGVYAGTLCTTTPARLSLLPCITDYPAEHAAPQTDVLRALLELLRRKEVDGIG